MDLVVTLATIVTVTLVVTLATIVTVTLVVTLATIVTVTLVVTLAMIVTVAMVTTAVVVMVAVETVASMIRELLGLSSVYKPVKLAIDVKQRVQRGQKMKRRTTIAVQQRKTSQVFTQRMSRTLVHITATFRTTHEFLFLLCLWRLALSNLFAESRRMVTQIKK